MQRSFKDNLIGRMIRQKRKLLGLTQEGLAEKLGMSYQQVQKYENGMSRITVWRLQQIAHCLQVPMDYLLKDLPVVPVVKEAMPVYGGLSGEEKRLLKQFRSITNPSIRKSILSLIQSISQSGNK